MMHILLLPIYNDWKSLNKLLNKINKNQKNNKISNILIIDDFSTSKTHLILRKFSKIKKITILRLSRNVGSQKAIYYGLNFLKKIRKKFYITVMDCDGEDNPAHIHKMLKISENKINYIVVSCRKDRKENMLIKFLYKVHLILTLLLTGKWITFGNFSTFHSNNLKKLLSNRAVFHAYSSAVIKNNKIIRTYSARSQRYYEKSKVSFFFLIKHSLKIIGVHYYNLIFLSTIYSFFVLKISKVISYFFIPTILIFNFLIIVNLIENINQKKIFIRINKIK